MTTAVHQYEPNQTVWVITDGETCPVAIRDGVVVHVRINITAVTGSPATNTQILYNILLTDDNGPTTLLEKDVFADLTTASVEYANRIGTGSPPA